MDDDARLGPVVAGWVPPPMPGPADLAGQYAVLTRLDAKAHGTALFRANGTDKRMWDYMPYGPFENAQDHGNWLAAQAASADPMFYAIADRASGAIGGIASYLRIAPEAGSIEVGHIALSASLRGTTASSEAIYLMMRWAFDAGYRRFEWKCNALNMPSRRAAQRLGFSYEGVFRQAAISKGRNRDTAWFACIDAEWPALRSAFERWLDAGNFDSDGRQRQRLGDLTAPILVMRDPALG